MNRRRLFYVTVTLGVAASVIAAVRFSPELAIVGVGTPAPLFEALDAHTGEPVALERYEGRVVLVNVWATWCGPCKVEMPSMQRLYEQFEGADFDIAAVSVDVLSADNVTDFTDDMGLTFDILHDQGGTINQGYQITGYPESFLVDRYGTIVKKVIGPETWDSPTNVALIEKLLAQTED